MLEVAHFAFPFLRLFAVGTLYDDDNAMQFSFRSHCLLRSSLRSCGSLRNCNRDRDKSNMIHHIHQVQRKKLLGCSLLR